MEIVDSERFDALLRERSALLLSHCVHFVGEGAEKFCLTRPLLSFLLAESSQLEELLDAYGARSNETWHALRMHVAMIKNFSTAGYDLLHLQHTIHSYDFQGHYPRMEEDTISAVAYVSNFLFCSLKQVMNDAMALGWPPPEELLGYDYSEVLPAGMLPKDRIMGSREDAEHLVIHLATSFLNNTEDAKFLANAAKCQPPQWRGLDFDQLSEASIRSLEERFHTLQSLYDTYISYSNIEGNDTSLRRLRGHISVVLHLLRVATVFIHFYERHIKIQGDSLFCHKNCVLKSNWYLNLLTHYLCHYSYQFLAGARGLCQSMLRQYAVVESREIPIPPYFGFHVRPATLISSIVRHYGSPVALILDKEYDASLPMNLFLANEWINQLKRQFISDELSRMNETIAALQRRLDTGETTPANAALELIRQMANANLLRVLVYPLDLEPIVKSSTAPTLQELMQSVIATLHAQRKINILFDCKVTFRGDVRVLQDIQVLAENGYGENETGANIPLPRELSYLSHYHPMN
ncbi:MAG: hypothetical protein ACI4SG_08220 [Oligosphaeraceae bacterium]